MFIRQTQTFSKSVTTGIKPQKSQRKFHISVTFQPHTDTIFLWGFFNRNRLLLKLLTSDRVIFVAVQNDLWPQIVVPVTMDVAAIYRWTTCRADWPRVLLNCTINATSSTGLVESCQTNDICWPMRLRLKWGCLLLGFPPFNIAFLWL